MVHAEKLLEPLPPLIQVANVEKQDAGLRSLDHYRTKLPVWRYVPRQRLIPLIRWETPYLAAVQNRIRSPTLDTYFSVTANLGTHTFFMIFLPLLFWCGYTSVARAMVQVLASGVFLSGVIKDMWCLPRPLSPPLHRITMSQSVSLEYGFPSTHSTNAVSVAAYALLMLSASEPSQPYLKPVLQALFCCYACSIIFGRLYCGMHGFLDVVVGGALGAILSAAQFHFGEDFDKYLYTGPFSTLFTAILLILLFVRIHPEPADDCPCYDDSVAFAGVVIGIFFGSWRFARNELAWDTQGPATVPFELQKLGWHRVAARIVLGILMVFAWREIMKPLLHTTLPPLFRVIEKLGLNHARRFFVQASDYETVPEKLKTDDVIPAVSEIPSILSIFRHPRRSRSVSIGPQSQADAYEALAFREKQRRESKKEQRDLKLTVPEEGNKTDYFSRTTSNDTSRRLTPVMLPTPASSSTNLYEAMIGPEIALYTPSETSAAPSRQPSQERRRFEKEDKEMFSKLEKPRVRYDVEVVTKLIVYAGIAWIACEGAPILFQLIGLGVDNHPG